MSLLQRVGHPRLSVVIPERKHEPTDYEQSSPANGGNLSPDLQPATPPMYPASQAAHLAAPLPAPTVPSPLLDKPVVEPVPQASKIGKYILLQQTDTVGDIQVFRAFHCDTHEEYVCKVVPSEEFERTFSAYFAVGDHPNVAAIHEVLHGTHHTYVVFSCHFGDLHSYVRRRRRLREEEAGALFGQIVAAVAHCHAEGLVLRDLKLRKFVFKNPERTELKLESVEDAFVLGDDQNDCLADKHGCPAYVSPEILQCGHSYSGRAADMWSAGVMLYTLLVGRYPFHDVQPTALFGKIRRGDYRVPETVSSRARCLIRALLRKDPTQRLTAGEVEQHPWFQWGSKIYGHKSSIPVPGVAASGKQAGVASSGIPESYDQLVPHLLAGGPGAACDQEPLPWFL